jgi:type IV secretion system protein VirD4
MASPLSGLSRLAVQAGCLASIAAIGLASVAFFPWPLFLAAALVAVHLRYRKPEVTDSYGSARWAAAGDLMEAGLMGRSSGLPLGYADAISKPDVNHALRQLFVARSHHSEAATRLFLASIGTRGMFAGMPIRLPDRMSSVVFGAPGSGKSTALFMPALMSCPEGAFVLDWKGEIARAVSRFRERRFGHRSYFIDPYGLLAGSTDTSNPLEDLGPELPDDLRDLANAIVYRSGKEPDSYWLDQAELILFAGMAYALTHGDPKQRHLLEVQEIIADAEARTAAIEAMKQSDAWGGVLRRLGHQIGQLKDREGASVISSALRQLNFLHSPPVAECLRHSSFDMGDLIRGKADVYLVIPPEHIQSQASYLRLMLASVIRRVFREGASNHRCVRIFADEAASLGRMTCIDQALQIGRGFGLNLNFAYQSMGQLLTCYPEGQHQTFLGCLGCQVFLGAPNDYQTGEYLSNLLGESTIQISSQQRSDSQSWSDNSQGPQGQRSTSHSTTWSEHGRKLLQPAETFGLGPQQAIIFLPGRCPPIRTTMLRYFEDKGIGKGALSSFTGRLRLLVLAVSFLTLGGCLLTGMIFLIHERQASLSMTVQESLGNPSPSSQPEIGNRQAEQVSPWAPGGRTVSPHLSPNQRSSNL